MRKSKFPLSRLFLCTAFVALAIALACPQCVTAQTVSAKPAEPPISMQTQQRIAPITPMIDANTFFVGHIDLTKIDPETTATRLKINMGQVIVELRSNKALAEHLGDEELAEVTMAFAQGLDQITRLAQAKVDELRSLGCNEIYLTANSKIMTVSAIQVVCLAPAANLAKVEKALVLPEEMEFGWVFQHDGDKLIANLITPFSTTSMSDANVGNRVAFQHQLIRPMLRPELAAGWERIKNAPIKLVFAPDGVIRGLWQLIPVMSSHYMMGGYDDLASALLVTTYSSAKTVGDGVRWVSVGLDPSRPVLAVTIQAKSPEAAQELHDMVVQQKVVASAMLASRNQRHNRYGYGYSYDNTTEQVSSALDFAMLFLPDVRGDQLQLTIDEKRMGDSAKLITNTYTNVILPSRESSHKMQCANNMKQIMLALHTYHDANKALPAPYTTDKNGKPMHSWRVALLPYMEQTALYEQIVQRMDEPWDSDYHKQFHHINVPAYQCPSAKNAQPGMTNYSVVVGKANAAQAKELGLRAPSSTAFPEPNKWNSFAILTDGTSNTISIVERKEPVCWMDPTQEITLEEAIKLYESEQSKVGSNHKGGFFIGLMDGSVHFWDMAEHTIEQWKAGLTANGGESFSLY